MELATDDPTSSVWRDLSPVISAEIARMSRLVEDLLLLAKVDEHRMRLHVEEVDLDDLVGAEVRRLRAVSALSVRPAVRPVRVMGDRARLGQAITNLADNAARHARSTVRMSLRSTAQGATVVIEDDGPGVPAAQRDRVFERFVRLDASRGRSSGGSGLGLSIVLEVVRAHGGSVRITDAEPQGCRVEIRLPHAPAERAEPSGASAALGVQPVALPAGGLDGLPPERQVDLAPQVADVDLDDVGLPVEGRVPHGVEDLGLVTTSPGWCMRYSSRPNSRGVRLSIVSPRCTRRRAGSSERSPAASTTGRSGAPRRIRARSRATRTMKLNGLVR